MSRSNDQAFDRGDTWYGPDRTIDTANLEGTQELGREKVFEDINLTPGAGGAKPMRTGLQVTCRLVRNNSTVTLYGKRLVVLDATKQNIVGYARADNDKGYPLDEFLPAGGVRYGDICWVVVQGPAIVKTPMSNMTTDIAAGDLLCALTVASSTSAGTTGTPGRAIIVPYVAATTVAQFTTFGKFVTPPVLSAISAVTTTGTNADLLIQVGAK